MKILFVASEIFPIVKIGGLADVIGSLPTALRETGVDVRVMLPAYKSVSSAVEWPASWHSLGDPLGAGPTRIGLTTAADGVPPLWLVDCPALFDRNGGPYLDPDGRVWPDNHLRFALLARAAAMVCDAGALIGWQPDILHAHDWHAGLAAAYLALRAGNRPATLFTIHNLSYAGNFPGSCLEEVGLPPESFTPDGVEFHGQLSFMKAGLRYSDHITTVSNTYAQEILTDEGGQGFGGLLRSRQDDLTGILNGIDNQTWNPAGDKLIEKNYDAARLKNKGKNKTALLEELGLTENGAPLFGVISRLTEHKGLDLVLDALPRVMRLGAKIVVLGSGDRNIEQAFQLAESTYPDQFSLRLAYDENLAHRIQAGADFLLVPSRFEPCGLTQLYALRYGTLPVVRRTGGLADTVIDIATNTQGTGFVFAEADADALLTAVRRAIEVYGKVRKWRSVQRQAMKQDFGWDVSASRYRTLYQDLIAHRGNGVLQTTTTKPLTSVREVTE